MLFLKNVQFWRNPKFVWNPVLARFTVFFIPFLMAF